jgi:hypothetical protein
MLSRLLDKVCNMLYGSELVCTTIWLKQENSTGHAPHAVSCHACGLTSHITDAANGVDVHAVAICYDENLSRIRSPKVQRCLSISTPETFATIPTLLSAIVMADDHQGRPSQS